MGKAKFKARIVFARVTWFFCWTYMHSSEKTFVEVADAYMLDDVSSRQNMEIIVFLNLDYVKSFQMLADLPSLKRT